MTSRYVIVCFGIGVFIFTLGGCSLDVKDPATSRLRLGSLDVAFVSPVISGTAATTVEIRGLVTDFSRAESTYTVTGKGTFRHFVEITDTTNTTHRMYHTVPGNYQVPVDTGMNVVLRFVRNGGNRWSLLLKTKSDSLLCVGGTLQFNEMSGEQTSWGAQGFRLESGTHAYMTRNTECGREGDFPMVFFVNGGSVSVPPAQIGHVGSGSRSYLVANITNTQIAKRIADCSSYADETAFMIIGQ